MRCVLGLAHAGDESGAVWLRVEAQADPAHARRVRGTLGCGHPQCFPHALVGCSGFDAIK